MRSRPLILVAVMALPLQAQNPPYLRELPSVERVKAELKGATPKETARLQIGARTHPEISGSGSGFGSMS